MDFDILETGDLVEGHAAVLDERLMPPEYELSTMAGCVSFRPDQIDPFSFVWLADACKNGVLEVEIWWTGGVGLPVEKVIYRMQDSGGYLPRKIRRRQPKGTIVSERKTTRLTGTNMLKDIRHFRTKEGFWGIRNLSPRSVFIGWDAEKVPTVQAYLILGGGRQLVMHPENQIRISCADEEPD